LGWKEGNRPTTSSAALSKTREGREDTKGEVRGKAEVAETWSETTKHPVIWLALNARGYKTVRGAGTGKRPGDMEFNVTTVHNGLKVGQLKTVPLKQERKRNLPGSTVRGKLTRGHKSPNCIKTRKEPEKSKPFNSRAGTRGCERGKGRDFKRKQPGTVKHRSNKFPTNAPGQERTDSRRTGNGANSAGRREPSHA